MISEEALSQTTGRALASIAEGTLQTQLALIQTLIRLHKLRQLKAGIGEIAMEQLQKALDRKNGESLAYCSLPADVYQDLKATGVLDRSGIRNYSVLAASNNDTVLVFYGSQDQEHVDRSLKVMEAYYGQKSELDKETFFLAARNRDLLLVDGLAEESVQLFRQLTSEADQHGTLTNAMPFTIIEYKGRKQLVTTSESEAALGNVLRKVSENTNSKQNVSVQTISPARKSLEQAIREAEKQLERNHPSPRRQAAKEVR